MASSSYDFRQFQAELAALDNQKTKEDPPAPRPAKAPRLSKKAAEAERMAQARREFLALREKHQLGIADVVAFFPEEEGIAYLQALLAQPVPRRRRRNAADDET